MSAKRTVVVQTLGDVVHKPMADWSAVYDDLTTDERYQIERRAAEQATHLARLSAYLSRRMSGGTHADAVVRQNQAARRVRQALGYTYADDKITF